MAKQQAVVWFDPRCGALNHPAFSKAEVVDFDNAALSYPVGNRRYMQGHNAQEQWAQDKIRHLRSWGTVARLEWVNL